MENIEIAATLTEMADLLEIQGETNPFRIRAYRNAVFTVQEHPVPLRKAVEEGEDLTELPAIGKDMASHITELVQTGRLSILDELAKEVPRSLVLLTRLPGVGPKRARKVWEELDITRIDQLAEAAEAGRIAELDGFGKKSEEKILDAIRRYERRTGRFRLSEADQLVRPLLEHLAGVPEVERLEVAGSYRRRKETVGDVDVLAIASDPGPVMEAFVGYPQVRDVDKAGDTRGTVHLASGLQVDLRILPEADYGAAMVYFTGSKQHNITLRKRALERGLSISEYGVFELAEGAEKAEAEDVAADAAGRDTVTSTTGRELGERVAGATEEEVYAVVGLPSIPAELREDRGEIAAADADQLPELLALEDIRGDLQMHSTWSDGKNTIEEMLQACVAKGYEYFALTDHSKALAMTGGLDAAKLREQWAEIEEITSRHPKIRLLRSMEVDILADGSLDLEDEMLEQLDLVVVSIHSKFDLPAAEQTARILRALEHPAANVLAHPTGRMINRRDPIEFDLEDVLACAAEHRVAMELNAHPARLDLRDTHLMQAKKQGVKIVISTDAHKVADLQLMPYGVEQARRAWLEPGDVLNTLPAGELLAALGG
jgi:DNA polymerase (family 10)